MVTSDFSLVHWGQNLYNMRRKARGDVSELADEHDLGSCAFGRVGSTPTILTTLNPPLYPIGHTSHREREKITENQIEYRKDNRRDPRSKISG